MSNTTKRDNVLIQQLCKEYCVSYSPVLLPKIAKYGFRVKGSPMAISFAAKMKLYDLVTLKKEDFIVNNVKLKHDLTEKNTQIVKVLSKDVKNRQSKISLQFPQKATLPLKNNPTINSHRNFLTDRSQKTLSRFYVPQTKQMPLEKQNWDQLLQAYQQLYEFIRIMEQRLNDLTDFIVILKAMNIDMARFEQMRTDMEASILKANKRIEEILPDDMFRWALQRQDGNQKFAWLKRKTKRYLHTDDESPKLKLSKNLQNRMFTESDGQDKIQEKKKKFAFLKRKSGKNTKLKNGKDDWQKRRKGMRKKSKFFYSIRPVKSFAIKSDKDDKTSKNTQQKLSEDLEQEHEQKMFQRSEKVFTNEENFRSQKYLPEMTEAKIKERSIRTWNHIALNDDRKKRQSLMNGGRVSGTMSTSSLKKYGTSPGGSSRPSTFLKPQIPRQPRVSRFSHNQSGDRTMKSLKSNIIESRSSCTSNSGSKMTFNGMKNNLQRTSNQSLNEFADKKNFRNEKKKKIRMGQLKRDTNQTEEDEVSEVSIHGAINKDQSFEKHGGNRRRGRALPISMNGMFQRILQDDSIQKIIQANREREHLKLLQQSTPKKKPYQPVLKRLSRGTDTTISGGVSTNDLTEDYFKRGLRLPKPKGEIPLEERQKCRVNYSDILQLQKSLRPIASYNEGKMITRYSTEPQQAQHQQYQFKYKHGKLVFNHEFYVRKDEECRRNVDEDIEREKSVKEESTKIDFMKMFKKCLERCDQPLQKGFDEAVGEGF